MISFLCLYPQINFAGGGGEPVEAPVYDELLNQISMREAEMLWQAGIPFYDVNTLEVWTQGYIPGAKFFNVRNWKKLLPENSRSELERLIQNSYDCINGKAFIQEYSAKEFNYQLKKLSGALNKPQTTAYVNNMADLLTHPIYKAADKPLNNKIMSNVLRTTKSPQY